MSRLILIALIGLFAQFTSGTLGMGYGVFSASVLIAGGLYPVIASATVHTASVFTTLVSGGSHLFLGNVRKEWLLPLIIPGVVGGVAGAYFLTLIPGATMKPFVAGLLLILGIVVLYRFISQKAPAQVPEADTLRTMNSSLLAKLSVKLPVLGLIAGFTDAVGGGGWGAITTPSLILSENIEPRKVVGTVNLAKFFITIAISATFIATIGWGSFSWDLVIALIIGGVIAAPIAAYLCKRMPAKALGILIGLLLIGVNLRTLLIVLL